MEEVKLMCKTNELQLQLNESDTPVPSVFCWTKMGTEAGQSLSEILRRKEFERLAGGGTFCWGIGNSLGRSVVMAMESHPKGVEILFSPMKSKAKAIDENPVELSLWTAYWDETGEYVDLPGHMVITSRRHAPSGMVKSSHYALMCSSESPITQNICYGELDAARVVNYVSRNALGASQVTAMVRYSSPVSKLLSKPYPIHFRAKMYQNGFIKLGQPVAIQGKIKEVYRELLGCKVNTKWMELCKELRSLAKDASPHTKSPKIQFKLF